MRIFPIYFPCIISIMYDIKYKAVLETVKNLEKHGFKIDLVSPDGSGRIDVEKITNLIKDDTCFYCGKKLQTGIHVDHFIPWSFVKDDKIWNFVLSCPACNLKKNNKIPSPDYIVKIEERNKRIQQVENVIIQNDFDAYSDDLIDRMWKYAKLSGVKEYRK